MKVLMAGGGTGGHIYPALSIAAEIRRKDPSAEVLFVGTLHGMEADLVPRAGYLLKTIHLYGFERRMSWRNLKNLYWSTRSLWDVNKILRNFRPDLVIGTGGYVCGPVVWMASLLGIPTLIQEQNAFPGITNRILGRVVDAVALGYAEAVPVFSGRKARVEVTGNPVREDLLTVGREEARRHFGFQTEVPVVLITGGSQGARSINQAAFALHRQKQDRKFFQILHITGQTDYNNIIHRLQSEGILINDPASGRRVVSYLHDMPKALAAADLVVSRAGALGLAELALRGVPAILIPYPHAAENHQEINARALEKAGAAIVIKDSELTGEGLLEKVNELIFDSDQLRKMATAAIGMGHPGAAAQIVDIAISLYRSRRD